MLSFFILGIVVTISAIAYFAFGWIEHGQFLYAPFIAAIVGLNFLFISSVQVRRERSEREGGRRTS
ncbi:hypothetical protein ACFFHM_02940 [Halalkalibacter kiskunsagensis]|uniref:Uncharacterized protein n=1 Tax=Halalkalibacter kiskunsagensis TaxID=1548599 RepID=A0ABV6K897_9BACI